MSRFAALLPIKDHSERIPGKNFRPLAGRPLWEHVIATLSAIEEIEAIYIDTDSERFQLDVIAPYPKVKTIERPEPLRGDFVSTNKLFAHDLTVIPSEFDFFIQTHTTNPLLNADTVRGAIEKYRQLYEAGDHDSLFSVTRYQSRFYWRDGRAVNHDPANLIRTQDLEPLIEENSNFYLFSRESFAKTNARIGEKPFLFEMDPLEAVDIDDMTGWNLAEALIAANKSGGG